MITRNSQYIIIADMKILFLCGREVGYPLNHLLAQSFKTFSTVDVISETGSGKSILKRSLLVSSIALPKLVRQKYDLIFVGFFGRLIMLPIGMFSRVPVLFNPFISTYETLVDDRKKYTEGSIPARLAFWLDKTSCNAADHILMDTQANINYFSSEFKLMPEKFSKVYIGSDENIFYPRPEKDSGEINIIYHGSYLPLQGVDVIIRAAELLKSDPGIRFRMFGNGLEYQRIRQLTVKLGVNNITFLPAVSLSELPEQIADSSIALGGHFGTSEKSARVIAGKTFQDIAMGKPTIVGDNVANRELFTHGVDAWLCPMNEPAALAEAIRTLAMDKQLRTNIGLNARETFMKRASLKVINRELKDIVQKVIAIKVN